MADKKEVAPTYRLTIGKKTKGKFGFSTKTIDSIDRAFTDGKEALKKGAKEVIISEA